MKIISSILLLVALGFSIRHGWSILRGNLSSEEVTMMAELGISQPALSGLGLLSLAVASLLLFPPTFFAGNLLSAVGILFMMSSALRVGNLRLAAIEVPFLLLPLALIWLKHPLSR
jgi:hypothetical protein